MNTIPMLTKLFPKTKNISEVAEILEKYSNFGDEYAKTKRSYDIRNK